MTNDKAFAYLDKRLSQRAKSAGMRVRKCLVKELLKGNTPNIAGILDECLSKDIRDVLEVSYLKGRYEARKERAAELSLAEGDLLDKSREFLEKLTGIDVGLLSSEFDAQVVTLLSGLTTNVESRIRGVLAQIIGEGQTRKEAVRTLSRSLRTMGIHEDNVHKIDTMFRTQSQLSYSAARVQEFEDPDVADIIWGYRYVTAGDERVRPSHEAIDGVTLPKDDPFWAANMPPNGYNCRCQVIPVFTDQEHKVKKPPSDYDGPDTGFSVNPGKLFQAIA